MVPKPTRRILFLLLAGIWLFRADPLAAESYQIAGRDLRIAAPAGYCAIDRNIAAERDLHQVIAQVNSGLNRVLLIFADCGELQGWRRGEIAGLSRHGQILTPIGENALETLTRGAFLDRLHKVMDQTFDNGLQEGRSRAIAVLPELTLGEVRSLGVLARDEAALYAGMAELLEQDGRELVMAGVVAISLANQVPLSVNLYRPYRDQASVQGLLAEQKRLMRDLLRHNGPQESSRMPSKAENNEPD